ncbi:hypothetical protein LIER_39418 [Lithospermum erythrorhizon]|uniref:Uncharacterized protein n=1 Tax=Lithospermum erythrorhizon TaxID=34254 RepID=A0AAV3QGT2_LITER
MMHQQQIPTISTTPRQPYPSPYALCHCFDDPQNCLVTSFCPCITFGGQYDLEGCALCQEYRELKNRGFDMAIGWQADIDRKNRGVTVAPIQRGMSR